MAENGAGHKNTARVRQGLEPRRDVDTVAVQIAAFHNHVAEVDTDAQHDLSVIRQSHIGGLHCFLQLDSALDCIHGAGELDQYSVANHLDDPTVVLRDHRLEMVPCAVPLAAQGPLSSSQ